LQESHKEGSSGCDGLFGPFEGCRAELKRSEAVNRSAYLKKQELDDQRAKELFEKVSK
jgi:hypothetical protein